MAAHPARVLVIEDDDTLSQFFGMVLEMLPVRATLCASAEQALSALREQAADLIVTDLFLPGLDGRGFLQALIDDEALRGGARLVVTSGSIDDQVRRELQGLGVWRVLAKPVSVKAFKACIEEALAESAATGFSGREQALIASHFDGHEALYRAYRDSTLQHLPQDLAQGRAGLAQGDWPLLRRVAHNLKGVMASLGQDDAAAFARTLEQLLSPAGATGGAEGAVSTAPQAAIESAWNAVEQAVEAVLRPQTP